MTTQDAQSAPPPFGRGGATRLLEALGEYQRHYDNDRRTTLRGPGQQRAMPTGEVEKALRKTGFEEGLDRTATELFFGPTGQDGYSEGDEYFATITHGGFVLEDHAEKQIYVMTYRSISGSAIEAPHAGDTSPHSSQWLISARASYYEVQPRFYEDLGQTELLPYAEDVEDPDEAGLASVYPVDEEDDVCIDTGSVAVNDVHRALGLANELEEEMAGYGVLCDPRVVLLHSPGLPLLPHAAHLECLREAERRHDPDDDGAAGEGAAGKYHLGAVYIPGPATDTGHRVRRSVSTLVPDQRKALSLAKKASDLGAYQRAIEKYRTYLDDPCVPARCKQDLGRRLQTATTLREQASSRIKDDYEALAGLLLSVLDERGELAKDALPRRQGV